MGREVKPTLYSGQEWAERAARGSGLVKRLLAQLRIRLISRDDALSQP